MEYCRSTSTTSRSSRQQVWSRTASGLHAPHTHASYCSSSPKLHSQSLGRGVKSNHGEHGNIGGRRTEGLLSIYSANDDDITQDISSIDTSFASLLALQLRPGQAREGGLARTSLYWLYFPPRVDAFHLLCDVFYQLRGTQ